MKTCKCSADLPGLSLNGIFKRFGWEELTSDVHAKHLEPHESVGKAWSRLTQKKSFFSGVCSLKSTVTGNCNNHIWKRLTLNEDGREGSLLGLGRVKLGRG